MIGKVKQAKIFMTCNTLHNYFYRIKQWEEEFKDSENDDNEEYVEGIDIHSLLNQYLTDLCSIIYHNTIQLQFCQIMKLL